MDTARRTYLTGIGQRLWNTGLTSARGAGRWCRHVGFSAAESRAVLRARKSAEIARPMVPMEAIGAMQRARGLLDEAIYTHIYEVGNGDVVPSDDPYLLSVAELDGVLATALSGIYPAELPQPDKAYVVTILYQTLGGNPSAARYGANGKTLDEAIDAATAALHRDPRRRVGKIDGGEVVEIGGEA